MFTIHPSIYLGSKCVIILLMQFNLNEIIFLLNYVIDVDVLQRDMWAIVQR